MFPILVRPEKPLRDHYQKVMDFLESITPKETEKSASFQKHFGIKPTYLEAVFVYLSILHFRKWGSLKTSNFKNESNNNVLW